MLLTGTELPGRLHRFRRATPESFELPESFVLKAAYPNPFNPTTTITYGLPAAAEVRITATDLLGRQVATLVAGDMKAAGYHTVQFNADALPQAHTSSEWKQVTSWLLSRSCY